MTSGNGKRCRTIAFVAFNERHEDGAKNATHRPIGTFMTWWPLMTFFR